MERKKTMAKETVMEKYEQLRNMLFGRHRVASQRGYTNIFFPQKVKMSTSIIKF